MDDEVLKELEQEVLKLTAELRNYDAGSEEYKSRVERIRTLSELANNGRKIAADYDVRITESDRNMKLKEEELALKKEELEQKCTDEEKKRKNNLTCEFVKGGFQIGGIVIPLWFYSWFLKQGYHFEKTGIVSSPTFRNLLRCIHPKK